MRIALVLTPLSDANLRLAAQIGVDDIVARYPGPDAAQLRQLQSRIADVGLSLAVIEGGLPMDRIKPGRPSRDEEIEQLQALIRNMGALGIPILCYNFMAGGDWSRTSYTTRERGGARVSSFDASLVEDAGTEAGTTTHEQMWENLEYVLRRLVPVAEAAGVRLAAHPDDPPVPRLRGLARILTDLASFERLVRLVPSPANGICFCQGTFAEMGVEIPSAIRRLARHIHYVHFRDVRGHVPRFHETFHDNGQTNMVEAMRVYREIGFTGPMRPDHVPQLEGEADGEPGYTMLGRLFAVGYMRGLIQAVADGGARL
jgi:mannonate dehydratase